MKWHNRLKLLFISHKILNAIEFSKIYPDSYQMTSGKQKNLTKTTRSIHQYVSARCLISTLSSCGHMFYRLLYGW